jgi:hypothetical protein
VFLRDVPHCKRGKAEVCAGQGRKSKIGVQVRGCAEVGAAIRQGAGRRGTGGGEGFASLEGCVPGTSFDVPYRAPGYPEVQGVASAPVLEVELQTTADFAQVRGSAA